MIHLAIDHRKKKSHAVALTDLGVVLFDGKVPSTMDGFASIKEALPPGEAVQSVVDVSAG